MRAAKTIQAAITKLEDLRDYFASEGEREWRVEVQVTGKTATVFDEQDIAIARFAQPADAALIVTLYRTIDTQLAILKLELISLSPAASWMPTTVHVQALALARAILGEEAPK